MCKSIHEISWWDLEFDRAPIPFLSTAGVPQTKWVKVGMPRIPRNVINGVFYLYASREDALAGRNPGGTGFIVRYDGTFNEMVPGHHFYGITNWHVACGGGYSVIRLNTNEGGTDVIELGPEEWHFIPGKYDVAVCTLTLDPKIHNVSSISTHQFAPRHNEPFGFDIAVGDDVFMIGLFVDHDGVTTNIPSARFGNISMLPNLKATIEQPTGFRGESYVVDMHSRTGFSGSPVYVYRTFGADLTQAGGVHFDDLRLDPAVFQPRFGGPIKGVIRGKVLFKLLGIHWGQFPEKWELHDRGKLKEARKDLIVEGAYVEGMSGMTCVIPAPHIMEVLEMPDLKDHRHPGIQAAKEQNLARAKPKAESAAPPATDDNPNAREDFTSLLGAAARKQPQGD